MTTCVFLRSVTSVGLSSAVFDRSSPILLGMDMAPARDAVIDTTRGTVYARLLGQPLPTMRMSTGHLAWDLRPMDEDVSSRQVNGRVSDDVGATVSSVGAKYLASVECE